MKNKMDRFQYPKGVRATVRQAELASSTYQTQVQIGDIIEGIKVKTIDYDPEQKLWTFNKV